MSQNAFSPPDFSGTARLFPLPNVVLFPHVAQPLHVFEPRYRRLTADALADDRHITMALLRPGWESEYHNNPPIHPVVCVGRIQREQRLADGRYTLLLQGLSRARVVEEMANDRGYRLARVELLEDVPVDDPVVEQALRQELGERVLPCFAAHPSEIDRVRELLRSPMPLGGLCDVFCFALPLGTENKQELLGEVGVGSRVRLLLRQIEGRTAQESQRSFPPGFSEN